MPLGAFVQSSPAAGTWTALYHNAINTFNNDTETITIVCNVYYTLLKIILFNETVRTTWLLESKICQEKQVIANDPKLMLKLLTEFENKFENKFI